MNILLMFLCAGFAIIPATTAVEAHAYGERYDLPIPLWMNLTGGALVVVLSFIIAARFLKPEISRGPRPNLFAIPWIRIITAEPVLIGLRILSVFLFVIGLLAGFIGVPDYSRNAAPTIFWAIGWVGLAFVSLLVGNVWLLLNPWLIVFAGANTLWRSLTGRSLSLNLHYPRSLGVLPGVLMMIGFVWFMLASGQAGDSKILASVVAFYSAMTWLGMFVFGAPAWLAHGEVFTLMFGLLARCSPTAVKVTDSAICAKAGCRPEPNGECTDCEEAFLRAPPEKREVTLRGYGMGLIIRHPLQLSMIFLVLQMLALVAFEGFMDTALWIDLMVSLGELGRSDGIHAPVKTTLSFVAATALLFTIFYGVSLTMRMIGFWGRVPTHTTLGIMGLFVLSLIPISAAYHVAHYLFWLFTQIQFVVPAASDPFAFGWNLFGGRNFMPERASVPLKVIWHTAVVAIVIGHMIAVYVAHRVALNVFGTRRAALLSQIPMLLLMVVYTMTSLWMLAQPIMG